MNLFIFLYTQSSAQQALMGTINTSMQAVQKAQIDLGEVDNLPPLGQDMVLHTVQCTNSPSNLQLITGSTDQQSG